ncbi:MAG: hypothetical protein GH148_06405 [Clostridia bacterium]|nr:hypothetical protein [Clostridia bacterium]
MFSKLNRSHEAYLVERHLQWHNGKVEFFYCIRNQKEINIRIARKDGS